MLSKPFILLSLAVLARAASLYEPADGKIIFGAWVDSDDPKVAAAGGTNSGVGGDSPVSFNNRLGLNAGVFHKSQMLPLAISPYDQSELTANLTMVEQTGTDAIFFLTVYPDQSKANPYDLYTTADIQKLAQQLDNISDPTKSGRRVMLRFAPEMNGNWFSYGNQPLRFVTEYRRIVDEIRKVTNRVSFVWAPNAANNYPFGGVIAGTSAADFAALDTNNDQKITIDDDPFTPYWPGEDYVDWVGISFYWKGDPNTGTPPHDNSVCPTNYFEMMVQGSAQVYVNPAYPFYDMFAKKYNKPFVMPEGGAAFALTQQPSTAALPVGAGQVAIEQGFWQTYLNQAFFTKFPKAKMFINFEYVKTNEDSSPGFTNGVTRDYRITWNAATLAALKTDLAALSSNIQWAVKFVPGADPLVIGGGQSNPKDGTASATSAGNAGQATSTAVTKTSSSASQLIGTVGLAFAILLFVAFF